MGRLLQGLLLQANALLFTACTRYLDYVTNGGTREAVIACTASKQAHAGRSKHAVALVTTPMCGERYRPAPSQAARHAGASRAAFGSFVLLLVLRNDAAQPVLAWLIYPGIVHKLV